MPRIRIEVPVQTTEDPEKIEHAVREIFPDAQPKREERWVRAASDSLATLLKKTGEERVQDAARGAMWRGRLPDNKGTRFELNKQAAYMGRINFNEVTHPLGDVIVTVEVDDLDAFLDTISPPTAAELAYRDRDLTNEFRNEKHAEEQRIKAMGTTIDEGLDELDEALAAEERKLVEGDRDDDEEE